MDTATQASGQKPNPINWKKIFIVVGIVVVVGGGLGFAYLNSLETEPLRQTELPASAIQPPPPQDELAGWKTYRNEKYGFEVKVPMSWSATSTSEEYFYAVPAHTNLEGTEFHIGVFISVYKGKTLQQVFNGQSEPKYDFSTDCTTISFANTSAYECSQSFSEVPHQATIFVKNDLVFNIDDFGYSSTTSQILSTFKFLEP